jgi:hypothetical protein
MKEQTKDRLRVTIAFLLWPLMFWLIQSAEHEHVAALSAGLSTPIVVYVKLFLIIGIILSIMVWFIHHMATETRRRQQREIESWARDRVTIILPQ